MAHITLAQQLSLLEARLHATPMSPEVAAFAASVGRQLAVACVAETGLDAGTFLDEWNANSAGELDEDGPAVRQASAWLVARVDEALADPAILAVERANTTINALWDRFVVGFALVAREQAEARAEQSESRAAEAERRLAQTEKKLAEVRKPPTLRRGTAFLRTLLTTERHVVDAVRKASHTIGPTETEARRLFKYEPLGAAERLVMHALASYARDLGLLDAHPWATASGAMPKKWGEEPPRVKIPHPGASEIARMLGYAPTASGKISGARRTTIERAIRDLTNKPRWIAMKVLLPPAKKGGRWTEDVEVRKEAWIESSALVQAGRIYLELHPAAIASHLKSFEDVPDLAARYDAARDALGAREMRDEWAIADDYARFLALSITAKGRRDGVIPARAGTAVGDLVLDRKLTFDTLANTLGLAAFAKKQGRPKAAERIRLALAFCEQMGSVRASTEVDGMWSLSLPYPESNTVDDDQLLLLAPDSQD